MLFDASNLLVMPGIIDIHGDAFERQFHPRPGVDFAPAIAWADTETQLLSNGITTAYHGVTLSWEPGLRSVEAWNTLLPALEAGHWTCDMRVHLRFEAYNLDALDIALADIAAGRVHLLAYNDHTPSMLNTSHGRKPGLSKYADRAGMTVDAFGALLQRIAARADEIPAALDRLGAAARAAGIPIASHDDDSDTLRDTFRARGAHIAEFPIGEAVAAHARASGDHVVMGSPNVVRGGSHLGWASAADMAERGVCTILSSDYFYPAMARAACILAGRGVLDWAQAWALVSANPAQAAGLTDRGTIETGKRADIVVLDPVAQRVVATIVQGRFAHLTAEGSDRLGG